MTEAPLNKEAPGSLLDPDEFFTLVDEVLAGVGRGPLRPRGPERQIIRVRSDDRVLQILAGAGSGKTEMLVWRVLYELFVQGTSANAVLVTTFTRKAATELSVRVVERSDALLDRAHNRGLNPLDPHVHDLRIGTIHSLCDSLLAEFDSEYMAAGTQVIDDIETRVRLTHEHLRRLNFEGRQADGLINRLISTEELVAIFRAPWSDGRWPANTFDRVSLLQSLLTQHTETWIPRCAASATPNGIEPLSREGLTDDLITLQQRWEDYLDNQHILDFATIQRRFLERQHTVQGHISHVFVDEFQDTNPVQLAIHLNWLSSTNTRLTVVGDDDQALYRFRGSDIACFTGLEDVCCSERFNYRQEKLENNWRSTRRIVHFCQAFRDETILRTISMPKTVRSPSGVPGGGPPRLLEGPWTAVCDAVSTEIDELGAQTHSSIAILLFSTSEKEGRRGGTPAVDLRHALESRGLRVYNARNKTAARRGSPVYSLLALVSYLIDPVILAPAGVGGRETMTWASCGDAFKASFSPVLPPPFHIGSSHASIQKGFRGSVSGVRSPDPEIAPLLSYIDRIRHDLVRGTQRNLRGRGEPTRLTLSGLVARLLTFDHFRNVGFTPALFREALFTQLLESQIAPTRRSRTSLDQPLAPHQDDAAKVVWPNEIWSFLNVFGTIVASTSLDDIEDDTFAENSIALLTFHQAKGLEFDHVYVGMTGRDPNPHSVLQTMVFSGQRVRYSVEMNGQPATRSRIVKELAIADRERELYVAMTRAKRTLTFLHDPDDTRPMTRLNSSIASLFSSAVARTRPDGVLERRWTA
jgi:DNA helicase-2/ATP-dependent DNA helicase PcrA